MHIQFASDHSLMVSFGDEISESSHRQVLRMTELLQQHLRSKVRNLHPAYSTILVSYNPLTTDGAEVERAIHHLAQQIDRVPSPEPRTKELPVCYGNESGPDLSEVAALRGLTPEDVIQIHSSADYLVYFLGFTPGFPYLGGMSERIAVPRLATPRKQVPAGSVAIGANQTGIYPVSSPGGWRIIGRTPRRLFFPEREPLTLLQMGDRVRFFPISSDQFQHWNEHK